MEYSILILTDALNQQKEQLSRIERVVVNDIRFEKIQQNSKQYTMYLIADLESAIKILNDSSAPIRPDEADKKTA